jgi:hypothetical protein
MRKLKKFNGGQIYTADFRKAWFYVGAYSQKHVIELMKEGTGYELNQSTVRDYWNKDAWGDNMKGIELTEPCVYVAEKNDETIRRLL